MLKANRIMLCLSYLFLGQSTLVLEATCPSLKRRLGLVLCHLSRCKRQQMIRASSPLSLAYESMLSSVNGWLHIIYRTSHSQVNDCLIPLRYSNFNEGLASSIQLVCCDNL